MQVQAYIQELNLSNDDMLWLHNATIDAFSNLKNVHGKDIAWVDGEVFTHMRRLVHDGEASQAIRSLFAGKLKNFTYRLDGRTTKKNKEMLTNMYNDARRKVLSVAPDPINELEQALLAMQASTKKVEEVATDSVKLRKDLEDVRVLLEDNEPLIMEENDHE